MRTKTQSTWQKHRVPSTCYINDDYTNVTKVYKDYIEFRTDRKHEKM